VTVEFWRTTPNDKLTVLPPGEGHTCNAHPAVFDFVGMYDRFDGDEWLMKTIIVCFLEDMPLQVSLITTALRNGDLPEAERKAHALRGASANVGSKNLGEAAHGLEKAAGVGDCASAQRFLEKLELDLSIFQHAVLSCEPCRMKDILSGGRK
jgi:HPt (histidine-containing phosphotransfer) domain-containing protein